MGKYANPAVQDAALAVVAAANRLVVLAGAPADYAGADAGRLAEASLTAGDFTLGDDPGGGRQLLVAEQAGLVALANGTADHVALLDGAGQRLLFVTTCPAQPLLAGAAVRVAAWPLAIGAPV